MDNKNKYKTFSKEELIEIIQNMKKQKKYGILWNEDVAQEDFLKQKENAFPLISHIEDKSIFKSETAVNHFLIEGDNFHSLFALNYSHRDSVDLIYIDPPYNTKSQDFVYNDSFVDSTDTYRHSKWLSFMYKRLKLARNLLKDDGCIFISINEEELAQLKLLCDEIFGDNNYLTTFTVKVRHEDRILKGDKSYQEVVEYLLLYRKSPSFIPNKRKKDNTSIEQYNHTIRVTGKPIRTEEWGKKTVEIFDENSYEISKIDPNEKALKRINIRGTLRQSNTSGRFYVNYIEPEFKDKPGYLFKVDEIGSGSDGIGYRYFLSPPKNRGNGDYFQGLPIDRKDIREVPHANYLDYEKEFNTVGYEGGVEFQNGKKPIDFLMKIFELGGLMDKKDGIVLDFFAGSGSTAHALMKFNEIHDKNHQTILCTKNEEKSIDIVDQVTLPRMKNIIGGYQLKRKEIYTLEEIPINLKNITKLDKLLENLKVRKEELESINEYDKVELKFENQTLSLIGIRKKNSDHRGYLSNLMYFSTVFVNKNVAPDQLKLDITNKCIDLLKFKENVFEAVSSNDNYIILANEEKTVAVYTEPFHKKLNSLLSELEKINGEKILYLFTFDYRDVVYGQNINLKDLTLKPIPKDILDIYEEVSKYID